MSEDDLEPRFSDEAAVPLKGHLQIYSSEAFLEFVIETGGCYGHLASGGGVLALLLPYVPVVPHGRTTCPAAYPPSASHKGLGHS